MIKRDKRSFIYNKRGKKKFFLNILHIQLNTHTVTCNNKRSQHQAYNEIHIKLKFLTFLPFNKLSSFFFNLKQVFRYTRKLVFPNILITNFNRKFDFLFFYNSASVMMRPHETFSLSDWLVSSSSSSKSRSSISSISPISSISSMRTSSDPRRVLEGSSSLHLSSKMLYK